MKTKVIKQDIGKVQIKWVYGGVRIQFKLCRKKDPLTQRDGHEIKEVIFAVSDFKKTCCMYKNFLAKKAIAAIQLRQTVSQLTAQNKNVFFVFMIGTLVSVARLAAENVLVILKRL